MGCSLSKDAESPSKGYKGTSSWDKVIHRRFTIQINRSLPKTSNGGYIAAIFSANYGILRKYAPVKMLSKKNSLQSPPQKESYPTNERSLAVKLDPTAPINSTVDSVLGVLTMSEPKMLGAEKLTESTKENLETIDMLELMEGLAEEEVSVDFDSWQASHESSSLPLPVNKQAALILVSDKPSDKPHIFEALPHNKIARRPRPSSISVIKSIEDVDHTFSARTLPPLKSSREVWQEDNGEEFLPIRKTILETNTRLQVDNDDISMCKCRLATSITTKEDELMRDTENLQRALSFKYMFNDTSIKRQNSIEDAQINEEIATICRSDSLSATTCFLYEGESISSPSSLEFSTVASFKDWLPSCSHPSKLPDNLTCGYDMSSSEMLHSFSPLLRETEHNKVSELVCTKIVSDQWPNLECQDESKLEECGGPVFDPEMVGSFENAMRLLSKEEWDSVRGMEDSPRNFLRLVKALKKSSSNSVRNQKGANLNLITMQANTEVCFQPCKSPDSNAKIVVKKWAFMRQNSLEIVKALSQVRAEDDMERASVVFYSSAQVGSKAYEDCSHVRCILQSLVGISYDEKSVSEHEAHDELRHALNISVALVPTIYVKGKYLVGIDSILHLYKKGVLGSMLKAAVVLGSKETMPCICRGSNVLACPLCKGRCEVP